MKTVRLKDETYRRLLRLTGRLQAEEGERKTVEDAVEFLLDECERSKEPKGEESSQ